MREKKLLLKTIITAIFTLLFSMSVGINVTAEQKFSYNVIFPENQIKKDVGFFDLKMTPGQKQNIQIEFSNISKEKTAIGISYNGAKTNSNGVLEYGDTRIENDDSLKFDFEDIIEGPDKVELTPGESKMVDFTITMPETSYDGVIAGGIQLLEENQNNLEEKESGSVVLNEFAYVTAVLLRVNDTEVKPELNLNQVSPGQSNFKNTVYVSYSNTQATYVDNMTTEVQISKKGESAVLYERKQAKMRMAPNTFISFPVAMNGEKMLPGDYTANILVTADNGVHEEWISDFKITKEEADKFNERDVGLEQEKGFNLKLVAGIIVGFFILFVSTITIFTLLRKKQTKKKATQSKKRKSKNNSLR